MRETCYPGGAEVGAYSFVEVAAARAEGAVRFTEVFAAFVEAAEFLVVYVSDEMRYHGMVGLTLDKSSTSRTVRTSNLAAWPMACLRRASSSWSSRYESASMALKPVGNVANAISSSVNSLRAGGASVVTGFTGFLADADLFFGLPRSMMEASDCSLR